MKLKLMAKHKNEEWQEVDTIDAACQAGLDDIEDRKRILLNEFQEAFGRAYLFKFIEE